MYIILLIYSEIVKKEHYKKSLFGPYYHVTVPFNRVQTRKSSVCDIFILTKKALILLSLNSSNKIIIKILKEYYYVSLHACHYCTYGYK